MKKLTISLFALLLSIPAVAADRVLVCEFTDQILSYRDEFVLSADGHASVSLLIGSMGGAEDKACWSATLEAVRYSETGSALHFEGTLTCVEGNTVSFARAVDLSKMETTGPWQGKYPCSWKR